MIFSNRFGERKKNSRIGLDFQNVVLVGTIDSLMRFLGRTKVGARRKMKADRKEKEMYNKKFKGLESLISLHD